MEGAVDEELEVGMWVIVDMRSELGDELDRCHAFRRAANYVVKHWMDGSVVRRSPDEMRIRSSSDPAGEDLTDMLMLPPPFFRASICTAQAAIRMAIAAPISC